MAPRLREYEVKKLLSLCLLYSRINTGVLPSEWE